MKFPNPFAKRAKIARHMAEEMEFHRDARARHLEEQGVPPAEAARRARIEFGSIDAYREEGRAALGYRLWDELAGDVRYAVRNIRKHTGFHAAVAAILTLAIGVNTAFFTLYSNYFLKPLEVRGADRHYTLTAHSTVGDTNHGFELPEIDALRQAARDQMEGLYTSHAITALVHAPVHRQALVASVSATYFPLLGGTPHLGRTFEASEEDKPVAVLSDQGARRLFPDTPNPIGRTLQVRSTVFTVIGVMPAAFTGGVPAIADFWIGPRMRRAVYSSNQTFDRYEVSGLLASGVSKERAEAALTAAAVHFARPYEKPLARVELREKSALLSTDDGAGVVVALVFAAFWTVLLIACANLANLYLARAASRTHEIAMRLSLGASRSRIVRQLLTESTVTALLGAVGGCALALIAVQRGKDWAVSLMGAHGVTLLPVTYDWRVFLYAALLGLAAGLAFGLMPAIEITTPSLTQSTRREASAFAGRIRPRRMRSLLIGGQVAASLVLLVIGAILFRAIQRVAYVDLGYDAGRVFALRLDEPDAASLRQIEQLPGVAAVAAVESVPLWGEWSESTVTVGGQTAQVRYNVVSPAYFNVLGVAIQGRGFNDSEAQARARVAVISRATAAKFWPGASPLGQTFPLRLRQDAAPHTYQVIGLAPDVFSGFLARGEDATAVYLPAAAGSREVSSSMARITGNIRETTEAIRQICARSTGCDPVSLADTSALQSLPFRIAGAVSGVLAALALLLTAVGLHGVAHYSVIQRRREIGVHLALGASPAVVVRRMLAEVLRCVAWGAAAGLPFALALSRLAASSILRLQTFDPLVYVAVPFTLAAATALACAVPARRAASVHPAVVLRDE